MSDEQPSDTELAEADALARALDGAPLTAAAEVPRDALEVAALLRIAQPAAALDAERAEAVLADVLGPGAPPQPARTRRSRWVWGGMGVASSVAVAALCLLMLRSQAAKEPSAAQYAAPAASAAVPHAEAVAAPSEGASLGVPAEAAAAVPKLEPVEPAMVAALAHSEKRAARTPARARLDRESAYAAESAKQVAEAPMPLTAAAAPAELAASETKAPAQREPERGQYEGQRPTARERGPAPGQGQQLPAAKSANPTDSETEAPRGEEPVRGLRAGTGRALGASSGAAAARLLSAQLQITPGAAGSLPALERAQAEYRAQLLQLKAAAVVNAHARADAALARGQAEQALKTLEAAFDAAVSRSGPSELQTDLAFRAAALALDNGDAERALRDAARGVSRAAANDPSLVSLWRVRAQAQRAAGDAVAAAESDARAQRTLQQLRAQ
jgi:hypothetical protein